MRIEDDHKDLKTCEMYIQADPMLWKHYHDVNLQKGKSSLAFCSIIFLRLFRSSAQYFPVFIFFPSSSSALAVFHCCGRLHLFFPFICSFCIHLFFLCLLQFFICSVTSICYLVLTSSFLSPFSLACLCVSQRPFVLSITFAPKSAITKPLVFRKIFSKRESHRFSSLHGKHSHGHQRAQLHF